MRLYVVASALLAMSGCLLFFDDGGKRPEQCNQVGLAMPPLRDPGTLTCQPFGGGCDPACERCPDTLADPAPIPSWGVCGSACEALGETSCAASPECRVVRDAQCAISGTCITDFIGCFPIDMQPNASVDCFRATDGWSCSRSNACTALHRNEPCPLATDAECPRDFALCVPEGSSPGKCHDPVLCRAAEPACPANTTPGIANGCFTGACIPFDLCEQAL